MKNYKVILVGLDGSKNSVNAGQRAIEMAAKLKAKLVLTTVLKPQINVAFGGVGLEPSNLNDGRLADEEKLANENLKKIYEQAKAAGVEDVELKVKVGNPKVELAKELPAQYQADLIIVGATGLNRVDRLIIGSTAAYVVRNSGIDTLVVNE